jgi:alpha/beta hydrolase family protein
MGEHPGVRRRAVLGVAIVAVITIGAGAGASVGAARVPPPAVSGPVTGGKGHPNILGTSFDLASVGYTSQEFFLSGTATAYTSTKPLTEDGRWTAKPASTAPYKTRIVVYRPADPSRFDGTVFVEWLNVTAGFESSPDWQSGHRAIIDAGAAWVGVSAQLIGVQGGQDIVPGAPSGGLKGADPARYASLSHPGDSYSYDIFSQAGAAIRRTRGIAPLGGLRPKRVIAMGESQSAYRMVTYIDAIHPLVHVFDGFLVHSRGAQASALSEKPQKQIRTPASVLIRNDVDVPVLIFETETDLLPNGLGYLPAQQPDSKHLRVWEVAGTAHADAYTATAVGFTDTGDGKAEAALLDPAAATGGPLNCSEAINNGPAYTVLLTALTKLERWVRNGTPPPRAPRLTTTKGRNPTVARDVHGNARGGIRTPLVDVPIATLSGIPNKGGTFCSLFGSTTPFDAATLAHLYPTHAAYVTAFNRSTDRALKAGFLLPAEAAKLETAAAQSTIGG